MMFVNPYITFFKNESKFFAQSYRIPIEMYLKFWAIFGKSQESFINTIVADFNFVSKFFAQVNVTLMRVCEKIDTQVQF